MPTARQESRRRPPLTQNSTRMEGMRVGLQQLFTGRSTVGMDTQREARDEEEVLSPKTPVLTFRAHELPSTRIQIPGLSRSGSRASNHSWRSSNRSSRGSERSHRVSEDLDPISTRPITPESLQRSVSEHQQPQPVYNFVHPRDHSRFVSIDPAEAELAELAQTGRRRRRRKTRTKTRSRTCGPKIRNRKIRAKMLNCIVSGVFLALMLTIYLALTLSNRAESQEFHVLLILVILITTIFFCHALIRVCMMLANPPDDNDDRLMGVPAMVGPGGFAEPAEPIRVALARDEEAAGIESDATKVPPPAYGLWRESVRVDPNRIFWQRNNEARTAVEEEARSPTTIHRPPSYMSDNGIDYVIEAAPRSIAPTTEVPLAPHPSEVDRWPGPGRVI
ncbi:hypothetical protein BP5796_10916 [Coleophoma crateriformis]|uniref:Transmembrane protein n=1 Tax=Coleophoma crateriformis TaxID=565419 RepID=A0A3D8QMC8_9HELO|nr:hypothetical protein BP5796_10916 [Coleophoma crateriformis]